MTHTALTDLGGLIASDAVVEKVVSSPEFTLTEGPVWHPNGRLYFSEIPGSKKFSWNEAEGLRCVETPTNRANGQAVDAAGNLIVCEHETSVIARIQLDADGFPRAREVLVSHDQGIELNSPNDVIVASDGTIYFTDPTYGRRQDWVGRVRELERDFRGVYALRRDGELRCLIREFTQPNGLCLSPDESMLYVNDSEEFVIRAFPLTPDGSVGEGTVLFSGLGDQDDRPRGFCDGMKCDAQGNIWVTGPDGIWVVSPDGAHLGTVVVPEQAHNLTWGDADWRGLYITNSSAIYRIRTLVGGAHRPASL